MSIKPREDTEAPAAGSGDKMASAPKKGGNNPALEQDAREDSGKKLEGNQITNDPKRPPPEDTVPESTDQVPETDRTDMKIKETKKTKGDPVHHPAETTATTKYNAPIPEQEARLEETELDPPKGPPVRQEAKFAHTGNREVIRPAMNAKAFDPGSVNMDELPVINDKNDIKGLKEGQLFIARFAHNPNSDDAWAVKQAMPDLVSGRLIRNGLHAGYWEANSHRSPVAQKTGPGTSHTMLG